ncbi:Cytochrome c oxidase subunit 6B [Bifiguratus adelaidae]|uniref:Cytochrome c oxidase subunit n=1 Tax=Bifiguratus adelaidae TaxID=1938954 RepID=A0A261XW84_9FUNG|nr:Cytochrome c oxidase subunit 6B [Bifiguratus adelaidae]
MSDADLETRTVTLATAGFDARFPNTNQTKHCWQNYVDYYKCINARGEDFPACKQFYRAYHSLCPNEWISKWDTERDEGKNPANFDI